MLYEAKAVISLPGDAFQRSEARAKTSFIVFEKRGPGRGMDDAPSIFMYPCRHVEIDDPKRRRWSLVTTTCGNKQSRKSITSSENISVS